ncbi:RNA helicase [Bacillus sp. HMF5848]|uniref:DEAD/DEAH box helicase n=1 Tax=Bacillus sp. HMF5848 TaxID=2495421 RepID=UPI000F791A63|nr:DEAD/DEAH box helicase [Bacillus sp. HMF5848]RSK27200.1 RNA helicase [Bacillus sp. HMF5848]
MELLQGPLDEAIELTKRKVLEDIQNYTGRKSEPPALQQYLRNRSTYLQQLWINIWINKVSNAVQKKDKKAYLEQQGYVTKDVDKKILNKLFRDEMRAYKPFIIEEWLLNKFEKDIELWENQYTIAREKYLKEQKEKELQRKRDKLNDVIERAAIDILDHHSESLYLHARYFIGNQLAKDLQHGTKYKAIDTYKIEEQLISVGPFKKTDYKTAAYFFEELTGNIQQTWSRGHVYFEYELYIDRYETMLAEYIYSVCAELVLEELPLSFINEYEQVISEEFTDSFVMELLNEHLYDLCTYFLESLSDEYLEDLLEVSDVPFDITVHKEIFERQLAAWELRQAEEAAEVERKRKEEERMLADIFGPEYHPDTNKGIRYVLHIGETNTGKTFQALERMKHAESGLYLAPLRLLALEVYDKLNHDGVLCNLKTGEEEKVVEGAQHIASTVEMFHEKDFYEVVVIDESQMLADKDRGFSWFKAITKANAKEVHIIGSHNVKDMLLQLLGDSEIELHEYNRDIPLEVEEQPFKFKDVRKGDALICFSRKRVLETASRLQHDGKRVSMIYGSMPPETRQRQVKQFIDGQTNVVVSTDAIGMGLNLPIRRIVFLENDKFDGTSRRRLTSQEVKQIAGRAGRKGIYNVGKVAFTSDINQMAQLLDETDKPVETFTVAPTPGVLERFQAYYRDFASFFELWDTFQCPVGTKKAGLDEERELYELIRGTDIETRFSMSDLYGFLHLPFSKKEPELIQQWLETMLAIVHNEDLPEPELKTRSLDKLELTYKSLGLHLLFLYKLNRQTEAHYWERLRTDISESIHESLQTDVKKIKNSCKICGKSLPWDHAFRICDECFLKRQRRGYARR